MESYSGCDFFFFFFLPLKHATCPDAARRIRPWSETPLSQDGLDGCIHRPGHRGLARGAGLPRLPRRGLAGARLRRPAQHLPRHPRPQEPAQA